MSPRQSWALRRRAEQSTRPLRTEASGAFEQISPPSDHRPMRRTCGDRRAISEHLLFELQMMFLMTDRLRRHLSGEYVLPDDIKTACIESLVIHVRSLEEFILGSPRDEHPHDALVGLLHRRRAGRDAETPPEVVFTEGCAAHGPRGRSPLVQATRRAGRSAPVAVRRHRVCDRGSTPTLSRRGTARLSLPRLRAAPPCRMAGAPGLAGHNQLPAELRDGPRRHDRHQAVRRPQRVPPGVVRRDAERLDCSAGAASCADRRRVSEAVVPMPCASRRSGRPHRTDRE